MVRVVQIELRSYHMMYIHRHVVPIKRRRAMSVLFGPLRQMGYVVRDIDAAMKLNE